MNIFNPNLCLAKQLKNSWSTNIVTELDPEKIPIEVVQGVPRLKMIHDTNSGEDWFACALPLNNSWEKVDISKFTTLEFCLYTNEENTGVVRLEDEDNVESKDVEIDPVPGEETQISIKLNSLKSRGLDYKKIRLLKIIGYKGSSFYVSELRLE